MTNRRETNEKEAAKVTVGNLNQQLLPANSLYMEFLTPPPPGPFNYLTLPHAAKLLLPTRSLSLYINVIAHPHSPLTQPQLAPHLYSFINK